MKPNETLAMILGLNQVQPLPRQPVSHPRTAEDKAQALLEELAAKKERKARRAAAKSRKINRRHR